METFENDVAASAYQGLERFVAHIHYNHKLWVESPELRAPPITEGKRGRPAKRLKLVKISSNHSELLPQSHKNFP